MTDRIDAKRARELLDVAVTGDGPTHDGATAPWHHAWITTTRDPPHGEIRDADGGHVADVCDIPCSALIAAAPDLAAAVVSLTEERDALQASCTGYSGTLDRLAALLDGEPEAVAPAPLASRLEQYVRRLRAERDAAIAERDQLRQLAAGEGFQHAMTTLTAARDRIGVLEAALSGAVAVIRGHEMRAYQPGPTTEGNWLQRCRFEMERHVGAALANTKAGGG